MAVPAAPGSPCSLMPPENLHGCGGKEQSLSYPIGDGGTGWCHLQLCKVFAFNLSSLKMLLLGAYRMQTKVDG